MDSAVLRRQVRELCLALPGVEERVTNPRHSAFQVRGKTFCYYLDDHHGDGRLTAQVKLGLEAQEVLVSADPGRYFRPPYVGHHGWVGVYLDNGPVDWEQMRDFIAESYRRTAPRTLAARAALNG